MDPDDRRDRIANLKQQLHFYNGRRKMVETDPELTADERPEQLEYHDRWPCGSWGSSLT